MTIHNWEPSDFRKHLGTPITRHMSIDEHVEYDTLCADRHLGRLTTQAIVKGNLQLAEEWIIIRKAYSPELYGT